jgi:hypothetical protein
MTRPHGRARVDPDFPEHVALCQRCGTLYNRASLSAQFQYAGLGLIDTGFKVCQRCMDIPNPEEKVLVLPPDPDPIYDALPNSFPLDMVSTWTLFAVPPGVKMFPAASSMAAQLKFSTQLFPGMVTSASMVGSLFANILLRPSVILTSSMTSTQSYVAQPSVSMSTTSSISSTQSYRFNPSISLLTTASIPITQTYVFQPSLAVTTTASLPASLTQSALFQPSISTTASLPASLTQSALFQPSMGTTASISVTTTLVHTAYVTSTGAGSYTVPNNGSVVLSGIGGGGNGFNSGGVVGGGGGAGAAFAASTVTVTAGQVVYYNVGIGGGTSSTGQTWAQVGTNAAPSSSSTGILAPYGPSTSSGTGATAISSGGVGSTVNYGGSGGSD